MDSEIHEEQRSKNSHEKFWRASRKDLVGYFTKASYAVQIVRAGADTGKEAKKQNRAQKLWMCGNLIHEQLALQIITEKTDYSINFIGKSDVLVGKNFFISPLNLDELLILDGLKT